MIAFGQMEIIVLTSIDVSDNNEGTFTSKELGTALTDTLAKQNGMSMRTRVQGSKVKGWENLPRTSDNSNFTGQKTLGVVAGQVSLDGIQTIGSNRHYVVVKK